VHFRQVEHAGAKAAQHGAPAFGAEINGEEVSEHGRRF
jgi:hypothetical protein